MKKILAFVLAVLMLLSLTACDNKSKDYETAMGLYNEGQYEQARELFEELADYEDSAEMVKKCDYQLALEYMAADKYEDAKALFVKLGNYEDSANMVKSCDYKIAMAKMEAGEYQEAREIFIALGDYKDSAANTVIAAQNMLVAYVKKQGRLMEKSADNPYGTVLEIVDGELTVMFQSKTTGLLNVDLRIGAILKPGDQKVVFVGTEETSSYAAYYTASASGIWDIPNYEKMGEMSWNEFEISGKTAQGNAYTQEQSLLNIMVTSGIGMIAEHIEKVLEDSGLGLTMADLGFISYK